jgi:hypothetical protein
MPSPSVETKIENGDGFNIVLQALAIDARCSKLTR